MRTLTIFLIGLAVVLGAGPIQAQETAPSPTVVLPDEIAWAPVPSLPPGAQINVIEGDLSASAPFTFRLLLPDGYRLPVHTHPGVERVTVLTGTLHLGFGDTFDQNRVEAMPEGSVAIIPHGVTMFGYATGETVLQVHGEGPWDITYVNPEEDPRNQ